MNQLKEIEKPLILIGGLLFGLPLLKRLSAKQNLAIATRTEAERKAYDVKCIKGNKRYTINLLTVAGLIYDAFYNADFFGFTEDEAKAIEQIKQVPKTKISLLATLYEANYGKNLRKDFIRFLDNSQYQQVQSLLN